MIRRSIEKPIYKDKIRLRSYGTPTLDDKVFLELKKKYDGIVYKRRLELPYSVAKAYMKNNKCMVNTQIGKEIQWTLDFYHPEPKMFIGYHRISLSGENDLRITIDDNLMFRTHDLYLSKGNYGESLLEEGQKIMEIKTMAGIPFWLVKALEDFEIMPTSFSKYGMAYKTLMKNNIDKKEVINYDKRIANINSY